MFLWPLTSAREEYLRATRASSVKPTTRTMSSPTLELGGMAVGASSAMAEIYEDSNFGSSAFLVSAVQDSFCVRTEAPASAMTLLAHWSQLAHGCCVHGIHSYQDHYHYMCIYYIVALLRRLHTKVPVALTQ